VLAEAAVVSGGGKLLIVLKPACFQRLVKKTGGVSGLDRRGLRVKDGSLGTRGISKTREVLIWGKFALKGGGNRFVRKGAFRKSKGSKGSHKSLTLPTHRDSTRGTAE